MAKKEVIDFSSIFHYAKKKYDIEWNPCNDIFFNTEIIHYGKVTYFHKYDMIDEEQVPGYSYEATDEENDKAILNFVVDKDRLMENYKNCRNEYTKLCAIIIINQYLIENNIKDIDVLITS